MTILKNTESYSLLAERPHLKLCF